VVFLASGTQVCPGNATARSSHCRHRGFRRRKIEERRELESGERIYEDIVIGEQDS